MTEKIVIESAYETGTYEKFPCIGCNRMIGLSFNGGELDHVECCGVTYSGRAKGYEIVAKIPDGQ